MVARRVLWALLESSVKAPSNAVGRETVSAPGLVVKALAVARAAAATQRNFMANINGIKGGEGVKFAVRQLGLAIVDGPSRYYRAGVIEEARVGDARRIEVDGRK